MREGEYPSCGKNPLFACSQPVRKTRKYTRRRICQNNNPRDHKRMEQTQELSAFASGFIATIVFILALNPLAKRFAWVDKPDNIRKLHDTAIPLTGGVAMMLAFAASVLWLDSCPNVCGHTDLLGAMLVMTIVGSWDDRIHLSARLRILIQTVVGYLLALAAGLSMQDFGNILGFGDIILPQYLGIVFTVFCVVGAMNAINMIDGVDGLAGGVTVVALVWLACLAGADRPEFTLLLTLSGCVTAYLCFNMRSPFRKRAAIFMGDAGSMMLGLVLSWLLITLSQTDGTNPRAFPPVVGLWLVAVPLLDAICLIISRRLSGKSPFKADRDHIHHILQDAGMSAGETTFTIIVIAAVLGGFGVAGWQLGLSESLLFALFMVLTGAYYYFIHHTEKLPGLISHLHRCSLSRNN